MCPAAKKGTKEAILHIAGVWGWNSDLETGNFVPKGETASAKVAESRVYVCCSIGHSDILLNA